MMGAHPSDVWPPVAPHPCASLLAGMTGSANTQGAMTIKFRLTQIALSYLRIRDAPGLPPSQVK